MITSESITGRWIHAVQTDIGRFERIPLKEQLHPNRILCGYLYLANLLKNPADFRVITDGNCIYLNPVSELRQLTDEDILYLARCGMFYEEPLDSIAHIPFYKRA